MVLVVALQLGLPPHLLALVELLAPRASETAVTLVARHSMVQTAEGNGGGRVEAQAG